MTILTIDDISSFAESTDLECKAAQGRDGNGELPESVWSTYSAMANTSGGIIYLGIEETAEHAFVAKGINDINRIKKKFWDDINEKNKVSRNILSDYDVKIIDVDRKNVLQITVPRARRQDRPVYIGKTPFGCTYLRRHEGDYKADDETVRRMLAESVEDSRDDRILENFGLNDLEIETVNAYRNRFAALKPEHAWVGIPLESFLEKIGVMGVDRTSGKRGLRAAGLLMFGRYETIKDAFPYYMVDYQERPEAKTEARWIDRIVPDGTWSGNLYDFYQKVFRKLTADIKIPFKLQADTRIDETSIHLALREALTNCIIHADYTGRVSILVVKRPDLFGFRNPGLMRVSLEQALSGGISDCRNHRLQDMFRYIGLGEHAGSGIPGILKAWRSQHWRAPLLYEDQVNGQTLLELRNYSLIPAGSIEQLRRQFGSKFDDLNELQRIILVTADAEGSVSHTRIRSLSTDHPKDISSTLAFLVKEGFLEKEGATRDAVYHLPGIIPLRPFEVDDPFSHTSSPDLILNSPYLKQNSPDLSAVLKSELGKIGLESMPGKIKPDIMKNLIIALCRVKMLSIRELSIILERDHKALQDQYLTQMVAEGLLVLKYPETKNHPDQAYGAAE